MRIHLQLLSLKQESQVPTNRAGKRAWKASAESKRGKRAGKSVYLIQGVQTLSDKSNLLILPIQSWSIYDSLGSN